MRIPDRRRHERHAVEKLCKIYDPASRRFAPGRTRDISRSGALVTIQWARPLSEGDHIDIIIARSLAATGEVQTVAVEFEQDIESAIAA